MMTKENTRSFGRADIKLPAILKGQETSSKTWEEQALIYNISRNSLGLFLNQEYKVGRLVSVTAKLPKEFDSGYKNGEETTIWGIIQHCTLIGVNNPAGKYHLGVALIGDTPPISYVANPLQNYRLCGVDEKGLWKVEEAGKEFIVRKYPRFIANIEVFLGQIDDRGQMFGGERVITDNISVGGIALFSSLDLSVGDCVKVVAAKYDFSGLAVVRNVTSKNNRKAKVCLEFLSARFPIDKLDTMKQQMNEMTM